MSEYTRPILLLRIDTKDRIENLCRYGHIYMSSPKKYHEKSLDFSTELISDTSDGKGSENVRMYLQLDKKDYERIGLAEDEGKLHYIGTGKNAYTNANQCIFCMVGVHRRNLIETNEKEYIWSLSWSAIQGLVGDKRKHEDCGIFVTWGVEEFVEKWLAEIRKRDFNARWGFVTYDDHKYIPESQSSSTIEYALEACFHKDVIYAEQREFRFAACNSTNSDIEDLKVGELSVESYNLLGIQEGCNLQLMIKREKSAKTSDKFVNTYYAGWIKESST